MAESINFRDDKQDSIKAVANPQDLATKVQELKDLQDEIAKRRSEYQETKRESRYFNLCMKFHR